MKLIKISAMLLLTLLTPNGLADTGAMPWKAGDVQSWTSSYSISKSTPATTEHYDKTIAVKILKIDANTSLLTENLTGIEGQNLDYNYSASVTSIVLSRYALSVSSSYYDNHTYIEDVMSSWTYFDHYFIAPDWTVINPSIKEFFNKDTVLGRPLTDQGNVNYTLNDLVGNASSVTFMGKHNIDDANEAITPNTRTFDFSIDMSKNIVHAYPVGSKLIFIPYDIYTLSTFLTFTDSGLIRHITSRFERSFKLNGTVYDDVFDREIKLVEPRLLFALPGFGLQLALVSLMMIASLQRRRFSKLP